MQPLTARLRAVYDRHIGPGERPPLVAWLGFRRHLRHHPRDHHVAARRARPGTRRDRRGRHLHHYNIGILLLALVGGVGLRVGPLRDRPGMATAYGTGSALIVDGAALLVDLQDVYWANDGRRSVDAAVGLIVLGGVFLAAVPFWKAVARELTRTVRP
jgi:hypothetical protein